MRKKLLALICALSMAVLMVACGNAENNETAQETNVVQVETSTQEENESEEAITESEVVADTEIVADESTSEPTSEQTEESTPTPTEEPKSEPAEEPTPTHEHSYTQTITKEATCITVGTKRYTCSCGDSYEKEYGTTCISDGNRVVVNTPTCGYEGDSCEHCIWCNSVMNAESIPATGHVPKSYWVCYTPTGDYYHECSICNSVITHTTTRPEGVEIREFSPIDSSTLQPVP